MSVGYIIGAALGALGMIGAVAWLAHTIMRSRG